MRAKDNLTIYKLVCAGLKIQCSYGSWYFYPSCKSIENIGVCSFWQVKGNSLNIRTNSNNQNPIALYQQPGPWGKRKEWRKASMGSKWSMESDGGDSVPSLNITRSDGSPWYVGGKLDEDGTARINVEEIVSGAINWELLSNATSRENALRRQEGK